MKRQELGVIGGTFDPIHIGHLVVAQRSMEELGLDGVIFVPAGTPPHKLDRHHTAVEHRMAMTRLAIAGNYRFSISDRDIRPDRPSYTVDLLRDLKADYPDANLTFIIGGDSLRDFPTWHDPEGIVRLARIAVVRRPGAEVPESVYEEVRGLREAAHMVDAPLLDVSATDLRARASRGQSIQYLVPDAVWAYVRERQLYRSR